MSVPERWKDEIGPMFSAISMATIASMKDLTALHDNADKGEVSRLIDNNEKAIYGRQGLEVNRVGTCWGNANRINIAKNMQKFLVDLTRSRRIEDRALRHAEDRESYKHRQTK